MKTTYTQEELLEGIRTSNPKVWSYAYKEYYPMIEKMILSKGGDKEVVKDIYQEGWVVVIQNIRTGKVQKLGAKLHTYLYAICRNKWIDKLRKEGKLSSKSMDEGIIQEIPEEELEVSPYLKQLNSILSQIGETCKKILLAFYIHRKNMEQMAIEFGYKDASVVKAKKYKCMQKAKTQAGAMMNQI